MPIRDEAINVFMGLPGDGARLELTFNHDQDGPYEIGTGYGHIAITAEDLDGNARAPCRDVEPETLRSGRRRRLEPKLLENSPPLRTAPRATAAVDGATSSADDPDGYRIGRPVSSESG